MKKYRCSLCGYCYVPGESANTIPLTSEGASGPGAGLVPFVPARPEFKELAESWSCPQCGGPKTKFRPYGIKRGIRKIF